MAPLTAPSSPVESERVAELELALAIAARRHLVRPRTLSVTAPAAGADWTLNVPTGVVWVILSLRATFVTSAAVANRTPRLNVDDGSTTFLTVGTNLAHAASLTAVYSWPRSYPFVSSAFGTGPVFASLPGIPYIGGYRLSTSTSNIQAGDQWSGITGFALEIRERLAGELETLAQELATGTHGDAFPGLLGVLG